MKTRPGIKNSIYLNLLRIGKPEVFKYFELYRSIQHWSVDRLHDYRNHQVKSTLDYAYNNHAFYKQKFDHHRIHPNDFVDLPDLAKFPVVTKEELKQGLAAGQFRKFPQNKVSYLSTSGSTGQPFTFPINQTGSNKRTACLLRTIEWYGHFLGEKNARIWRSEGNKSLQNYMLQNLFGRRTDISFYDLDLPDENRISEARLSGFLDQLRQSRAKILDGYVSALTVLAEFIIRTKAEIRLDVVVTGAEFLPDYSRSIISKAFNCIVLNRYGGSETGLIAHESPDSNGALFVAADLIHLELEAIDFGNPNSVAGNPAEEFQAGNILVTDFSNLAMPLIRYRIGDVGSGLKEIHSLSKPFPILQEVEGRVNDFFVMENGDLMTTHMWHVLFRSFDKIKNFQVIQKDIRNIEVNIVPLEGLEVDQVRKKAEGVIPGSNVALNLVEHLDQDKSGKFRHTISLVPHPINDYNKNIIPPVVEIGKLKPYLAVHDDDIDREHSLKLDWNEGTINPPQAVIRAISDYVSRNNALNWYPPVHKGKLLGLLSEYTGVTPNNIDLFIGSDGAIDFLARLFINPGDLVVMVSPTYDQSRLSFESYGGNVKYLYFEDCFDPEIASLNTQLTGDERMVYLCNPNNPTGWSFSPDEIEILLSGYPNTLFLIDEAYIEFSKESSAVLLAKRYSNIFVSRTFSKSFCLASIRLGYLIFHERYRDIFSRIRNVKEIPSLSIVAAETALVNLTYYDEYIAEVISARDWLVKELEDCQFEVKNTDANYVMLKVADPQQVICNLAERDVYVRDRSFMPQLDGYIRITIGTMEQTKRLKLLLSESLA